MNFQQLERFTLAKGARGRNALLVQLWWLTQSTLFKLSPQFLYRWRCFLLRLFGAKIGRGVIIRQTVCVTYPWKLVVGDNVWIGDDVELYNWSTITIEDNAVVSQRTYLCTATHDYTKSTFDLVAEPITIKEQTWIATDVFIAPGVTIGKGAVIGACSSVFNDMPGGMICVGSPAKPVKPRIDETSEDPNMRN